MSIVKSFAVGNGDMFYIKHATDNFTIIDSCMSLEMTEDILNEPRHQRAGSPSPVSFRLIPIRTIWQDL